MDQSFKGQPKQDFQLKVTEQPLKVAGKYSLGLYASTYNDIILSISRDSDH